MPTAPTITAADNRDGTGAVVSITGGDAGSTHTLYAASWSGGLKAASFASVGSRTGNGLVTVAGLGYRWLYCVAEAAGAYALSSMIGYRATSGDDDLFSQCLDAVTDKLKAMSFEGITSDKIAKQKLPWNFEKISEGIFVSPVAEKFGTEFNNAYDIGYGVQITTFAASNASLTGNLSRHLMWRQQIRDAFHNQPLPGLAEVGYIAKVEPGPVIDIGAWKDQFDAGVWVVRPISREHHGIT